MERRYHSTSHLGRGGVELPSLSLSRDAQIRNQAQIIDAVENLRTYCYRTGRIHEAKLHAFRLGCLRAELRQMKAGLS